MSKPTPQNGSSRASRIAQAVASAVGGRAAAAAFGVVGAVGTIIGVVQSAAGALVAGILALAGSITLVQLGVGKGVKPKGKQRGKKRRALVWSGWTCALLAGGLSAVGLTSLLHSASTDEPPPKTEINVSNTWQLAIKPDAPDAPVPPDREGPGQGSATVPTGPKKQNPPDPSAQVHHGSSGSSRADEGSSKQEPNGVAPRTGPPADVARAKRKRSAALREVGSPLPLPHPFPVTPVDEAGGVAAPDEPGTWPASAPDAAE